MTTGHTSSNYRLRGGSTTTSTRSTYHHTMNPKLSLKKNLFPHYQKLSTRNSSTKSKLFLTRGSMGEKRHFSTLSNGKGTQMKKTPGKRKTTWRTHRIS